MTIPMIVGQMGASILIGALISKFGKWKRFMLLGSLLVVAGSYLMTTLSYDTDYFWVSVYMVVLGAGLGMVMQNLTLVVQNDTPASQLGAASSNVNFFRTIAGTIGVTIMGSLLATQVTTHITSGLKSYTPTSPEEIDALKGLAGGGIPHVSELPDGIRVIIENAYGNGIADVFWIAVPLAVLSVIAIAFLPNKALSTKTSAEQLKEEFEQVAIDLAEAEIGAPVTSATQLVEADAPSRAVDAADEASDRDAARKRAAVATDSDLVK